jgi:hypothetical protein
MPLDAFCRKRKESYWLWVKEKPRRVDQDFSNQTCGAYFKPYKEHFSLQTLLGEEVNIPEKSLM